MFDRKGRTVYIARKQEEEEKEENTKGVWFSFPFPLSRVF